mmetsp:Transcript_137796/g.326458  ORF Transcript_137796/g.326458 Transcript_137796/m.326458 type:complete len:296 (-) Transcript_137796:307-1194(-)
MALSKSTVSAARRPRLWPCRARAAPSSSWCEGPEASLLDSNLRCARFSDALRLRVRDRLRLLLPLLLLLRLRCLCLGVSSSICIISCSCTASTGVGGSSCSIGCTMASSSGALPTGIKGCANGGGGGCGNSSGWRKGTSSRDDSRLRCWAGGTSRATGGGGGRRRVSRNGRFSAPCGILVVPPLPFCTAGSFTCVGGSCSHKSPWSSTMSRSASTEDCLLPLLQRHGALGGPCPTTTPEIQSEPSGDERKRTRAATAGAVGGAAWRPCRGVNWAQRTSRESSDSPDCRRGRRFSS